MGVAYLNKNRAMSKVKNSENGMARYIPISPQKIGKRKIKIAGRTRLLERAIVADGKGFSGGTPTGNYVLSGGNCSDGNFPPRTKNRSSATYID